MLTTLTNRILPAVLGGLLALNASAQTSIKPYTIAYSDNLKGGASIIGNTSMHILNTNGSVNLTKMNQSGDPNNGVGGLGNSQYGNDNENMQFIDIDDIAATRNSSSADLVLPAGTNTIKFARLYWGGRILNSVVTGSADTLRKVKIRKGTSGAYSSITAPAANVEFVNITSTERVYQAYMDITNFVNNSGTGTYTVADIPLTVGSTSNGGRFGGWSIVVAYENQNVPYNSVRVYDGYAQVFNSGAATTLNITLSGLNVPNNPLAANEAVMSTMAWEGDANLGASAANPAGDFLKINNVAISNAMNPVANFWNGSITKNGANVTTKNPSYFNQMGLDIDEVNVGQGYGIQPNATSLTVQFGTEADQYFPSVFTFTIRMKDPVVTLDKSVSDASGNGFVEPNEELTYTLYGVNSGVGTAYNAVVIDTLPANVTYVPNTLEVVDGAGVAAGIKTDAADTDEASVSVVNGKTIIKFFIGTGATGTAGGQLAGNATYSVRFKVKASAIPGAVVNTARINANSQAGDSFTDDGTAIIGDQGGPLPVKLSYFQASLVNNHGLLKWTTTSEINSDFFEIERSEDGIHFSARGKVSANGSSALTHNYQFNDELNTSATVVYYRLKIVDLDGKYNFSKIVAIRLKGATASDNLTVYPNPFISDIKIALNVKADDIATVRVISFDGRQMIRRTVDLQKGDNIVVLNNFGVLSRGSYILEVTTSTDKLIRKIVKN